MRLENKVAIVTGAGQGIRRAIALAYAKEGAKLALASRIVSDLEETEILANELGAECVIVPADDTEQAQGEAAGACVGVSSCEVGGGIGREVTRQEII